MYIMYSHLHWMSCSKNAGANKIGTKENTQQGMNQLSTGYFSTCGTLKIHYFHLLPYSFPSSVTQFKPPAGPVVGVYSHAYSSYGIHFESLRHLFQIISIRCQEELGLGTKKTIIQQKHLTNFDKTRPGETATQPNPFSKTYSRVATWSQQCLNIKLRKEQ